MRYVKNTIWNKQLPSYLGIVVLLIAVGITVLLSRNTVFFVTKASTGSEPKNLQISNVTDKSFTVSFTTDIAVSGYIAYGANNQVNGILKDVRDQKSKDQGEYRVHYFDVENLTPSTTYVFVVTSDIQNIEKDKDGKPFTVTTAAAIASPSAQADLAGSVALAEGGYPTEGIVSLLAKSTQNLTALIQPDGSYKFSLSQLRTNDLTSYAPLTNALGLNLYATNGIATASAAVTADQRQVPQIILGQAYDFANAKTDVSDSTASSSGGVASESAGFPVFQAPKPVDGPEITIPSDNQKFNDSLPTFKGRALASTPVHLEIEAGKQISVDLQSDSTGVWEFTPPVALETGNHSISIQSANASGSAETITHNFTVLTEGSQFIEPSVSPVDISPTIDPRTLTPTIEPTATPSATATPSPTMDPNATMSGTITPTRGPINATGSTSAILGVVTSVLFLASGVILFFLIAV